MNFAYVECAGCVWERGRRLSYWLELLFRDQQLFNEIELQFSFNGRPFLLWLYFGLLIVNYMVIDVIAIGHELPSTANSHFLPRFDNFSSTYLGNFIFISWEYFLALKNTYFLRKNEVLGCINFEIEFVLIYYRMRYSSFFMVMQAGQNQENQGNFRIFFYCLGKMRSFE